MGNRNPVSLSTEPATPTPLGMWKAGVPYLLTVCNIVHSGPDEEDAYCMSVSKSEPPTDDGQPGWFWVVKSQLPGIYGDIKSGHIMSGMSAEVEFGDYHADDTASRNASNVTFLYNVAEINKYHRTMESFSTRHNLSREAQHELLDLVRDFAVLMAETTETTETAV